MDVLNLPVYERRYFLGMKNRENSEQIDAAEVAQKTHSGNEKGTRQSTVSGEALKTKMKNGDIPLK